MYKLGLLFLLLISSIFPAWADDTVEAAATGNIIFEKTPELIMQDELLTISKSASKNINEEKFSIDVDFHFKNISDHDVTRKIAFVLPSVRCQMDENTLWRGLDSDGNGLKDFTTTVNNKSQSFTTRTEAVLGQRNITDLLTKLQIPLNPCKIQTTDNNQPDPRYSLNLKKYHLLTETNEAAWSENIYFEWTQTFPAGKVINIHHHYTPVIGESVPSPRTLDDLNDYFIKNTPPLKPVWNRNPITLIHTNPSMTIANNNQKRLCVMPKWVKYHLTTGANWNGGIGVFKLIIKDDTRAPFAVNEFYKNNNGMQTSINENAMTFTIKNFIPTQDLFVLFLSIPKSPAELQACGI
ncbi:MAG: DUF4424 family protein [Gammaproteobacteria bacterium]